MASVTDSKYEEGSTFMLNPKGVNQNNLRQFKDSKIVYIFNIAHYNTNALLRYIC